MNIKLIFVFILSLLIISGACKKETIEPPKQVILEYEVTNVSIYNGADGAIQTNLIGGEEPFTYFWSTGENTPDISGLIAGEYTLRIVYGENSVLTETIEVMQPEPDDFSCDVPAVHQALHSPHGCYHPGHPAGDKNYAALRRCNPEADS